MLVTPPHNMMCWRVHMVLCVGVVVAAGNIPQPRKVEVNKCCERNELMVDGGCRHVNDTSVWNPVFNDGTGKDNVQVPFGLLIGYPKCYSRQLFPIYHIPGEADRLALLPNGHLRHYYLQTAGNGRELWEGEISPEHRFFDYKQGLYCLDKVLHRDGFEAKEVAIVCNPHIKTSWQEANFLLHRIVDPLCHAVAISCYLAVAIIHFVLPQLRDLVGNMITTICACLAVGQVADTVKIFTEFTNSTIYLIADSTMHATILGAFLWLNSAGYYIWKTFRSRNVFLRITDGRKYCYYSVYVWICTIMMTVLAVFAHLVLDTGIEYIYDIEKNRNSHQNLQGAIGWLGISVFSTAVAITIVIDIFFYISTFNVIKRMSTYGRIHYKMKYSFNTYGKLLLVITLNWIFLLLSLKSQTSLKYCYMLSNLLQGPIVLYICVCSQKKVRFLLRKTCCYDKCIFSCCRPKENEQPEWGEESMAMNTR